MKKLISVILVLAALAVSAGLSVAAETDLSACSITDGVVTAVEFEDVTAPCSGTLYSFDLNAGDTVSAGDLLFEMLTHRKTAPSAICLPKMETARTLPCVHTARCWLWNRR